MKLVRLRDDVISFAKQALLCSQQRCYDHRELVELKGRLLFVRPLFLDDTPRRGDLIMVSGAIHRARQLCSRVAS